MTDGEYPEYAAPSEDWWAKTTARLGHENLPEGAFRAIVYKCEHGDTFTICEDASPILQDEMPELCEIV